jgi:hypothetical protein
VTGDSAPANASGTDEVLDALDSLLVVLLDSTQRNRVATRRAQTIRRLRSHGRSYSEILGRVAGSLTIGITRRNVDCLIRASDRLHRAEVRALRDEGVALADIARLCGVTERRASALLAMEA